MYLSGHDDERVTIQEPALNEIKKSRSCFRRTCCSGCGCLTIFLIAAAAGIWLFVPPEPKKLTTLPDTLPDDLPLYKRDAITGVTYLSADRKKRGPETVAILPKIIITPLIMGLDRFKEGSASTTPRLTPASLWNATRDAVKTPLATYRHTVVITWNALGAEPHFIDEWYQNEFKKQHFEIERAFTSSTARSMRFRNATTTGTIFIDDAPGTAGTDRVVMDVEYPS
ncbi:MAG: hypothetical protein HY437_01590 [Candidatus Magasanikbacteria bacterium]|nr:hypothetical protein [Candidatus Magasanikbacteria bacterium]